MKKLIAIGVIAALVFTMPTFAQTNTATVMSPALDTLTNVDTSNLVLKVPGSNNILTVQLNVVKLTGTTAGTATLQGSLDGLNYKDIKGADTLTLANASQVFHWVQPRSNYLYYKVRTLGTGTQSTQLKAYLLFRP